MKKQEKSRLKKSRKSLPESPVLLTTPTVKAAEADAWEKSRQVWEVEGFIKHK